MFNLESVNRPSRIVLALTLCWTASSSSLAQELLDAVGDVLPESALLRQGSVRFSSPEGVMEIVLSKDNQTLVSFGRLIIGWDVQSGRELWRKSSPLGYLPACYGNRAVTLDADGEHFLLADSRAGVATRWNMRTGLETETTIPIVVGPEGLTGAARAIDATAQGERYFVGNGVGYKVFDAENELQYEQQASLPKVEGDGDRLTFGGPYCYGRFSPNGERLAVVTSEKPQTIQLLSAATGETLGELVCKHNVVRMEFAPNSQQLAVTERDTAVRLYECQSGELVWECVFDVDKRSENYTSALAFSPDGDHLVVCERNQTIFKVEAATGKHVATIRQHSWNPWAVVYTADGHSIFSSGWGGTIHQWDAESLEAMSLPKGVRGSDTISLSKDGRHCASVDQAGRIHLVTVPEGVSKSVLKIPEGSFEVVEFSWDSSALVAGGSWSGEVHIVEWDLETSEIRNHWHWGVGEDPVTGVEDIVFAPDDGKLLVSVFRQDAAYLINRSSQTRVGLPHRRVYGAAFSPVGDQIYTAGWDKMLRVWDSKSGDLQSEQTLASSVRDTRMYTVCADPKSKYLATATLNESIGLYDPDSKELVREWDVGASFVFGALRFSPDGLWLASGNTSGQILIWDPETGEQLHKLDGHDDHVFTIDFGRDNSTICSGGSNLGYVWSLRPSELSCQNNAAALEDLLGSRPVAAYHAWWFLLEASDESVALLVDRCLGVHEIYDIDGMVSASNQNLRDRRRELLLRAVASDPEIITVSAAERIVSVLSHIETPAAKQALNKLAERNDRLGQIADWELARKSH